MAKPSSNGAENSILGEVSFLARENPLDSIVLPVSQIISLKGDCHVPSPPLPFYRALAQSSIINHKPKRSKVQPSSFIYHLVTIVTVSKDQRASSNRLSLPTLHARKKVVVYKNAMNMLRKSRHAIFRLFGLRIQMPSQHVKVYVTKPSSPEMCVKWLLRQQHSCKK
jgi:hypothetical protein